MELAQINYTQGILQMVNKEDSKKCAEKTPNFAANLSEVGSYNENPNMFPSHFLSTGTVCSPNQVHHNISYSHDVHQDAIPLSMPDDDLCHYMSIDGLSYTEVAERVWLVTFCYVLICL